VDDSYREPSDDDLLLELERKDLHRLDGTVNEAALLEWPAAREFHAAMGKTLKGRR
jgi:hypothetical protein